MIFPSIFGQKCLQSDEKLLISLTESRENNYSAKCSPTNQTMALENQVENIHIDKLQDYYVHCSYEFQIEEWFIELSCIATLYSSAFSSQVNVWMQVAVTDSGVFYYSING